MDRKAIIAVTLTVIALFLWQQQVTRRHREALEAARAAQQAPGAVPPAPDPSPAASRAAVTPAEPTAPAQAPQRPQIAEVRSRLESGLLHLELTNLGGGIASAILLKHQGITEGNITINDEGPYPIGAITDKGLVAEPTAYETREEPNKTIYRHVRPDGVVVRKTFSAPTEEKGGEAYTVRMEVEFNNPTGNPVEFPAYFVHSGAASPLTKRDIPTYTGFDWYHEGKATFIGVNWFDPGKIPLVGIQTRPAREEFEEAGKDVLWAGVKNQYFTSIVTPHQEPGTGAWATRFGLDDAERGKHGVTGAIRMPGFTVPAGASVTRSFDLYVGPKEMVRLKSLGENQHAIMNFGMFRIVSETLLASMNGLHRIFANFGGYATAIIVLTLIIRSLMWPLQNASTKSMKKMQLLTPKMNELREKYKDDPTRMNEELMKLYKQYGVNPFSGCLPMLIQIPIFFGFYAMLGTAVELRHASFFWVSDLSQPDTVFRVLGFPINILPILMAGTMLYQMSLTPKTGDPMQQRVLMFMPLIFIAFCYNYASALALYWTVQNIFSIVQLYLTRNQLPPTLEKVPAVQSREIKGKKKRR